MNVQSWELADVLVVGLAAASAFKLVAVDTITQRPRYWLIRKLRKPTVDLGADTPASRTSRNRAAMWVEYLWGCGLCFPMWAAIFAWVTYGWTPGRFITYLLAARMVAWMALRWINEHSYRDWPEGYEWPPLEDSPEQPS